VCCFFLWWLTRQPPHTNSTPDLSVLMNTFFYPSPLVLCNFSLRVASAVLFLLSF
jgi:hypothetical protein